MELRQYIFLFRKWLWLLLLSSVLGGAGAYIASVLQTPVYESTAKVMVVQPSRQALSELGYLSGQQLVQTYAELILTRPIRQEVAARVGVAVREKQITIRQVQDTSVLDVSVTDIDSMRAAIIANQLIDVLVERNDEIQSAQFEVEETSLATQIEVVQLQIVDLQSEIDQQSEQTLKDRIQSVEGQIDDLHNDIVQLQLEISSISFNGVPFIVADLPVLTEKQLQLEQSKNTLDLYQELYFGMLATESSGGIVGGGSSLSTRALSTMALYEQIYRDLLSNFEAVRLSRLESSSAVIKVEPAIASEVPVRPKPFQYALLGIVMGAMIGVGIVFLREYMDDTVRHAEDVIRVIDRPFLGHIPEFKKGTTKKSSTAIYSKAYPRSPVAEAFRYLRTSIEFASAAKPIKTILVTSPSANDGKSSVASNLAAVMEQGGKKVLLLEADMRKPSVHRFLGLSSRAGISDYFRGVAKVLDIVQPVDGSMYFMAIASGKLPPNPAELISSEMMQDLLRQVSEMFDYVIIDSPPTAVADPIIISAIVDGVILVLKPGTTRTSFLIATHEQLKRANARVLGVVFNQVSPKPGSYYSQDYYSSEDSMSAEEKAQNGNSQPKTKKSKKSK